VTQSAATHQTALANSLALLGAIHHGQGDLPAACATITEAVNELIAARIHGAAIARAAKEIGGRYRRWHTETERSDDEAILRTLGELTGVKELGEIS